MVGPYRLDGELGRGGMGEVYRAYDERRQRTVALKLLSPSFSADDSFRERFRRESLVAASLNSPHSVPIHDFGAIGDRLFIDMRLIEGRSLYALLAEGPLTPSRAVSVLSQVGEVLSEAHGAGIIHRDIKPSNILVTENDFAYLLDFGIAHSLASTSQAGLTQTGMLVGTFGYIAPERLEGADYDARADVYSLGCVLAEMLTGQRPYARFASAASLMRAHLMEPVEVPSAINPAVPIALDAVVARAMAKAPDDRYSSVEELCQHAMAAMTGTHTLARNDQVTSFASTRQVPPTATSYSTSRSRFIERRTLSAIAGAAAVALLAGISLGLWFSQGAPETTYAVAPADSSAPSLGSGSTGSLAERMAAGTKQASTFYTYSIRSNHRTSGIYVDENGTSVTPRRIDEFPPNWTLKVPTEKWGADQRASLQVSGAEQGDTFVECSITDDHGRVVVQDRSESSHAATMCFPMF